MIAVSIRKPLDECPNLKVQYYSSPVFRHLLKAAIACCVLRGGFICYYWENSTLISSVDPSTEYSQRVGNTSVVG
jgi:hypothetical protein